MMADGVAGAILELKEKTGQNDKDIGRKLKMSAQTVRLWRRNNKVPDGKARAFEKLMSDNGIRIGAAVSEKAGGPPKKNGPLAGRKAKSGNKPDEAGMKKGRVQDAQESEDEDNILPFLEKVIAIGPLTLTVEELKWLDTLKVEGFEPSKELLDLLRALKSKPRLRERIFGKD